VAHVAPGLTPNDQVISAPLPSSSLLMNTLPASHPPPGTDHSHLTSQSQNYASGQTLSSSMGAAVGSTISSSGMPGNGLSGHLVGVISQTDILNLYARVSGLSPLDPAETRSRRRRSSSSSISLRKSGDIGRELGPS
jgi:hypothetical protein